MFWQRFTTLCVLQDKFPNNVAAELGFSNATATHWKQGSTPRAGALQKIADYFGVTVEYLKGETDIKNPADQKGSEMEKEMLRLFKSVPEGKKQEAMRYLQFLSKTEQEDNNG